MRFDTPHLFLLPVLVRLMFARPPLCLRCPVSGCCWVLAFFSLCATAVSGVPCFPARGALGLGSFWSSALGPPPFVFPAPPCLLRSLVPGLGCCGPWCSVVPPRGPPLCFFFPFFSFSSPSPLPFFFFLPCPGVPVVRFSGWFVCPGLWGVLVCVAQLLAAPLVVPVLCVLLPVALRCGGVFCVVTGAVWGACVGLGSCSALLPPVAVSWSSVVACGCVLSWDAVLHCSGVPPLVWCAAVVPCCFLRAAWCCVALPVVAGCSLLGLVAYRCFPLACFVAGAPAWLRGLLPCCVLWFVVVPRSPLLCPVLCGALLPRGAVLWRPAVRFSLLVELVCVSSLCVRCRVALRVVLLCAGVVCAAVGASWCGVSLCVVVSPWAFCGVVVLLWCVVVCCSAVRCPVVCCALRFTCSALLPCGVVLAGCAVRLSALLVFASPFVLFSFAKNPCCFSVPLKTF